MKAKKEQASSRKIWRKTLKEGLVLGYGCMNVAGRVIVTIGDDVRRNGLAPKDALDFARLLGVNAVEANEAEKLLGNIRKEKP